ncbi:MAG: NAD(P)-dependent oxidoreductase [Pirellulaceae bacterium]|nr:D-2-hydroxyacid dehydrogenase [Planctomycetaceae bacterium]MDG1810276.1 NAD(P)-dependent oxidoreductase [Pirellulaceae bacterium]MDG2103970.1 NAD(P)-dependent oxidoreductase [Pirellulaceae bacterium]
MKLLTCFPLNDRQIAQIQAAVPDWEVVQANQENVAELIGRCDVFCGHGRHHQIAWPDVVAAGRLKWIQSSAAGMDHCLVPAVINSEIEVSGCSGLFCDSVAEQAMALVLALLRRLPTFFQAQQNREFVRRPTDDLHGKTIGIIGFGGNGQRIAEVLQPFGNRVLATDLLPLEWQATQRIPPIETLMPAAEIGKLLKQCEVVILTAPLNPSTERLMGAAELRQMPRGSYLINVGRGKLVDEEALLEALRSEHLQAAGLDVTWTEPPPADSPLWSQPNLVLTPHVGAQAAVRYQRVVELLLENLKRFCSGKRLRNRVDKQLGFSRPEDRC